MATSTFRCRLVTPADSLLDEPVSYANVPAHDGLMGFAHGRAPAVVRLGLGPLTLKFAETTHGGGDRTYLVDGGFAQMAGGELIILAEHAVPAETIAETDAQAELDRVSALKPDPEAADAGAESDRLTRQKERARLALRLAKQARSRGI